MRALIAGLALAASSQAFAANIAIYDDLYGAPWSGTAAANLGHSSMVFYNDGIGFAAACASADMCIVESPNWYPPADVGVAIAAAVANGTPVIVEYWTFAGDPQFNTALGIIPTDYSTPLPTHSPAGSHNFFSRISGGSLVWPGSYDAGLNSSTFALAGSGWIGSAQSTIAVTNNDGSIANGFLSFDFQNADSDVDGILDVVEIYEEEISYLLSGGGPEIQLTGSPCPTSVSVSARGFTPGGRVAVVRANGTGSAVIPSGSCAGTMLGLGTSGLSLVTTVTASGAGAITWSGSLTAAACGKYYQMVDMTSCATSNVDQF